MTSEVVDGDLDVFPRDFAWGVATAAYQIEGATAEGGRGPSIWDVFSHTPGRTVHGDTGDIACDHYHRVDTDLELIRDLGINLLAFDYRGFGRNASCSRSRCAKGHCVSSGAHSHFRTGSSPSQCRRRTDA